MLPGNTFGNRQTNGQPCLPPPDPVISPQSPLFGFSQSRRSTRRHSGRKTDPCQAWPHWWGAEHGCCSTSWGWRGRTFDGWTRPPATGTSAQGTAGWRSSWATCPLSMTQQREGSNLFRRIVLKYFDQPINNTNLA